MNIEDFFAQVGGDYDSVMSRLSSDALIIKFVRKFTNDPSYVSIKKAFEENDVKAAFLAAHTLKGTAANLGLDTLANAASELTEALRNAVRLPGTECLKPLEDAYNLTIEKISELEG